MDKLKDAIVEQAVAAVGKKDPTPWQSGHASGLVDGLRMAQEIARRTAREDHETDKIL